MQALKWDFLSAAIKKLNARAGSMQAKTFGLADDLATIRDALAEVQRNAMSIEAEHERLSRALHQFLNPAPKHLASCLCNECMPQKALASVAAQRMREQQMQTIGGTTCKPKG